MTVDPKRSEAVLEACAKVMELEPPDVGWMTAEAAEKLNSIIHAAYTYVQMELLKRQVPPDEAQREAAMQAPLLAFQLGMQVGRELEVNRALREMFGE